MSTDYWDKDGAKHTPKWDMKCPFCGTTPTKVYVRMIEFPLSATTDERGHAADNVYSCGKCGYSGMIFGVAVSKQEYEDILIEGFTSDC